MPLFFEYLFYKSADHNWNPLFGNKIHFILFIIIFESTHLTTLRKWLAYHTNKRICAQ